MKKLFLSLLLLAFAATAQTSTDGTSNSFIGAIEAVGTRNVQVNLTATYAATTIPEDYVDVALPRPDTSAVLQSVVNKSAPLEVFAAAVAQAILDKYPQMQSVGVQILFASSQATQQTVQAVRTRPAKVATAATAAKSR